MIKDFLQYMFTLGKNESTPQIHDLDRRTKIVMMNGSSSYRDVLPPVHALKLDTIESLGIAVAAHIELYEGTDGPTVYVNSKQIAVQLSPVNSEGVAAMALKQSEALTAILKGTWKQSDLVRLLRTKLAGCFDERFLAVLKRVDFRRMNATSSKVSHTGDTLGKAVEASVQSSEGDIPEIVTFTIPIFGNADLVTFKETIRFAVDSDPNTETFSPPADGRRSRTRDRVSYEQGSIDGRIDARST